MTQAKRRAQATPSPAQATQLKSNKLTKEQRLKKNEVIAEIEGHHCPQGLIEDDTGTIVRRQLFFPFNDN